MTGTVDIQELKGRASWLKDRGVKTMICYPSDAKGMWRWPVFVSLRTALKGVKP